MLVGKALDDFVDGHRIRRGIQIPGPDNAANVCGLIWRNPSQHISALVHRNTMLLALDLAVCVLVRMIDVIPRIIIWINFMTNILPPTVIQVIIPFGTMSTLLPRNTLLNFFSFLSGLSFVPATEADL